MALAADESVEAWSATAAVTLARSWAAADAPVRLVDLSVWSPRLEQALGLEPADGATDVVLHGVDPAAVTRRAGDGLEVIGAGKRVWDPARVLADGRLAELLAPPSGGLTAVFVPLDLPGCERALERADAVVLLAPAHADADFLLGDALGRAVAWVGPGDGGGPGEDPPAGVQDPPRPSGRGGTPEAAGGGGEAAAVPPERAPRKAEGRPAAGPRESPPPRTGRRSTAPREETRPRGEPPPPVGADAEAQDAGAAPADAPPTRKPRPERPRVERPAPLPEDPRPERPPAGRPSPSSQDPPPGEGAAGAAARERSQARSSGERAQGGADASGARQEPPAREAPEPAAAPTPAPGPVVAGATPVLVEPREPAEGGEPGRRGVVGRASRRGDEGRGRWTVVLAEDNDDHALLVQMSLRWATRKPVLLYRARNGDEAIRLLDGVTPDLLLLDLKMPGRTGLEVLEHVKGAEALRRIPVAVLTSSDRDEDVERAYGLGGNHFLTKPDDPRKLQQQLRTLLDNLWELRSIRRGRGVMEATGVTAVDPPALVRHRAVSVALAVAVLAALLLLAWSVGLLG